MENNEKFEEYVKNAIEKIPDHYTEKMQHVAILVDEEPSQEQRVSLGLRHCDQLFGLYEGVPLTKRGGMLLQIPPDRITIFKHPMLELFPDEKELERQIYETLWHEVAHFFGLNHEQIHKAKKK
jgi:predicted Zn-dependent protease with MMP-like domain